VPWRAGSVEALVTLVSHEVEEGIRKRFERVQEMKEGAGKSVGRGREYVAAYVAFIHYAGGSWNAAAGPAGHAEHKAEGPEHVH